MTGIRLTAEQAAAVDMAASGETFVLDAPAGSGKSSTASKMAEMIRGRGLYLVYNRAAKDDAEGKFPSNFTIKTTAAIGWGAYWKIDGYERRMNFRTAPRVPSQVTAKLAGVTKPLDLGTGFMPMPPFLLARMAMEAIDRFCFSAEKIITDKHVPMSAIPAGLPPLQAEYLRTEIRKLAWKIWLQAIQEDSEHKFTMDYAFKLFISTNPQLGYDTVIVDEAQDSNMATHKLVSSQAAQQVAIGDPAQQLYCQPVGSMVEVPVGGTKKLGVRGGTLQETAKVPIEDIKAGDSVVTYDNSHVYKKGRKVSHVTRFQHDGRLIRVTTAEGLTSSYTDKHHCVVRVGDSLMDKYVVYMMRQGDKFRVGRTRFMYQSQSWSFGVALRGNAESAEAAWILSVHDTIGEASLAEALVQHQYNLPGVRFEPTHERDRMDVKKFWAKFGDNKGAAQKCLEDHGRLIDYPLWVGGTTVNPIGVRRPFITAAANLIDGMSVLPLHKVTRRRGEDEAPRRLWEEITVSSEYYTGDVVSLEVDEHHNYFGDGILTHNSWRGAVDIMSKFDGPRLQLTQSFRFGERIAEEAEKWLAHTGTGIHIKGLAGVESSVINGGMALPNAVLCRTNATAMRAAIEWMEMGRRVAIVGGTDALKNLAFAAIKLKQGQKPSHPELMAFSTWAELMAFTEEPGGGDLKALVQLINTYGSSDIIDACNRVVDERRGYPDVVVSTAHKAKGREWHEVQVADDFKEPDDVQDPFTGDPEPGPINTSDAMLHYVTVTRARKVLDRGSLAWIDRHEAIDKLGKVDSGE